MRALIGVLFSFVLVSCGGGGGGNSGGTPRPPPPPPPLTLSSSAPATGAGAAIRPVTPVLTFSAPLDAATVTSGNISLQSIAGNHAIVASVSGRDLTVTPTGSLLPLVQYTLNVGTTLRGTGGESLATPVAITFTTADGEWKAPATIETGDGPAVNPVVAFDADGHALAVWQQTEGQASRIWANRYTSGEGWGTAEIIEPLNLDAFDPQTGDAEGDAVFPQVAIDANGNALCVAEKNDSAHIDIWSVSFD